MEELLESGVDSDCQDEKKRTPLHFAAAKGNEELGEHVGALLVRKEERFLGKFIIEKIN